MLYLHFKLRMNLLLLSNSTMPREQYLSWALPHIQPFLYEVKEVLFVPYAAVTFSHDEYEGAVRNAFFSIGKEVVSIHKAAYPKDAIERAQSIVIGGGNSFRLLQLLQEKELLEPIRQRVNNGVPYIGWSAGSNVACPSIRTTNDMPIVEPVSLEALNLFPYQINPHYTEKTIPGHGGESRGQRLKEYLALNKTPVVCLPEGTLIEEVSGTAVVKGSHTVDVMFSNSEVRTFSSGEVLPPF